VTRSWAGAVLVLCACHSSPHEADAVVAEVKAPIHARIMLREHEEPVDCTGTTGVVERITCIFHTSNTTCHWLEIDSPELSARPFGTDLNACNSLPPYGARVRLAESPTGWELEADPAGTRLAYHRPKEGAIVAYVLDGVVVGANVSTPVPVKWSDVPTLDDNLVDLFTVADAETGRRLLAYAERSGGETKVVDLMRPIADSSVDRWFELYDRIEDAELKSRALAALHERVREEDAPKELLVGLIAYPEVQPADFHALLADAAKLELSGYTDWYSLQPLLDELAQRKDPLAGELACRVYGMQVLSSMPDSSQVYYEESTDLEVERGALAIVARQKTKCPWVQIALDNAPCSEALRCLTDGGLPDPEAELDDPYDPVTGEPIYVARPLCSRAVAAAALGRLAPKDDEEYEPEPELGPLLLAAGYAEGVVSRELLSRNARRMYRYQYPKPPPPDEDGYPEEPPCSRPRNLPDAVCKLPLSVSELVFNNCRARIDDKAQVVRVEELKAK
jgi:hypothetical protein